MSKADLIEIHVVFDTPKEASHLETVGAHIVQRLRRDLAERFPKQLPTVYVSGVRGEDE